MEIACPQGFDNRTFRIRRIGHVVVSDRDNAVSKRSPAGAHVRIGIDDNADNVTFLACLDPDRHALKQVWSTAVLLDFVEMWNPVVPADVLHDVLVVDTLDEKDSSICHFQRISILSRVAIASSSSVNTVGMMSSALRARRMRTPTSVVSVAAF